MINLYSPLDRPYTEINYLAVAITGDESQRHVGLIFRADNQQQPMLLHLAFHCRLHCDSLDGTYFWLDCCGFSDDEKLQLAVWLKKVWEVNGPRIPYGINYSSAGYFDEISGRFVQSEDGIGLSCATLVMALFRDFGYPIVNEPTWESRASDAAWHCKIVNIMRQDQARYPHIYADGYLETQALAIGKAVRFRPEEVAASASAYVDVPICFDDALTLGNSVVTQMGLDASFGEFA